MTDIIEVDTLKQLALDEHDSITTGTKKSLIYGWDSENLEKVRLKTDAGGNLATIEGLSIPEHDYIGLSYTGTNLTGVVYKIGGADGTTVATLTLAYDGDKLISITKT